MSLTFNTSNLTRMLFSLSLIFPACIKEDTGHAFGGKPKYSQLQVKLEKDVLSFELSAVEKHELTFEGPWTLELTNLKGLSISKLKYSQKDFDLSDRKYKVKVDKAEASHSLDYKLVAFVCTKDKTKCYREVHKGAFSGKKST